MLLLRKTARIAILLVVIGFLSSDSYARIPHLVRYQGTVTDRVGVPLEGPYTLTFRVYDRETGGTPLWQEVQPNVPVTRGAFSVLLGSVTPLNISFDRDIWLSVQVAADPEMTPRIRLSSVPTAYRAEVAESLATPITMKSLRSTINRAPYRFNLPYNTTRTVMRPQRDGAVNLPFEL